MATYDPSSLGIKPPTGGFQQGGWYSGRQYWGGTLSDPGVIHPSSNQQGSGQAVSAEVNKQSDQAQGLAPGTIQNYIAQQTQQQQQQNVTPVQQTVPSPQTGVLGAGAGITLAPTQPEFNLPELYKKLTESSGIKETETQLSDMDKAFTEAKGKINDNPYLSEATRVGRVSKLETLHAERTANIRNDIATKKADTEMQLNLQTKQFDINSQMARDAQSQLAFMLESGALDNASGEDIATLTRATGYSSNMIMSAIQANKKKNVQTDIIQSEDDNGVVTVSVIDKNTGALISQQSLGAVGTKTKTSSGSSTITKQELQSATIQDLEANKNDYGHVSPDIWQELLSYWLQGGGNRADFEDNFQQYADPNRGDFDQAYFKRAEE